jgi:hypothetical protein
VQDLDVCSDKRRNLVVRYAWAVPDEHAIEIILKYSPIVEIGCGTGYWASLIASKGGIVFPYDAHVPGIDRNPYEHEITYCNVLRGSIEVLDKLKFTLFLCWPPHNNSFAYDALMRYRGDTLIYVGEDEYGCTADRTFFKELSRHWKFIEGHKLPQWDGIYDYLEVHKRI